MLEIGKTAVAPARTWRSPPQRMVVVVQSILNLSPLCCEPILLCLHRDARPSDTVDNAAHSGWPCRLAHSRREEPDLVPWRDISRHEGLERLAPVRRTSQRQLPGIAREGQAGAIPDGNLGVRRDVV